MSKNIIYIFFAAALWLLPSLSTASERQGEFYKIIGNFSLGRSVAETKDGYIVAGSIRDKVGRCCRGWVIKIDKSGTRLWEKTLGENYNDYNFAKVIVIGNEAVLAGATDVYYQPEWHGGQFSSARVWAVKLDSGGAVEWENRLKSPEKIADENADVFPAVLATDVKAVNGRIIMSGFQEIGVYRIPAIWLLDSKGKVLLAKSIDVEKGRSISADGVYPLKNGDFLIAGGFFDYSNNSLGTWLARIGPEGAVNWEKVIETEKSGDDEGLSQSIAIAESNEGVIVGAGQEYLKFSAADKNGFSKKAPVVSNRGSVWLNKFKKDGGLEWRVKIEEPNICNIKSLWTIKKQDDEIVAAGETCKDEKGRIWVATFSASGRVKSIKKLFSPDGASVQQIIPIDDRGLIAVGVFHDKETGSPSTWVYRAKF